MTDRELMQWALDALDGYARNCKCEGGGGTTDAAEALRARLAQPKEPDWSAAGFGKPQPEQEPVVKWDASAPLVVHPHPAFQATPPQPDLAAVGEVGIWGEREWQGLTNDEVNELSQLMVKEDKSVNWLTYAIEAKLKEKNAI